VPFKADVLTILQQQVFGSFKNRFVFLRCLTIFTVSNFIDDPAELGYNMEQIKDNFRLRYFFLTALIKGSHISMTTALMDLRCLVVI